ncbi:hypothetical protein Rsub_08093 [Raphidocelis subcapitata]|uniref:Protein root UVB sensitive/RUS domain-containing protein n=1 Tax=Raphidocelis subcapitata TaxID=307507 RepID=A0A2V0PDK0_9CHLO|nr:hypothetical protein Rsub_08093 [Raphidocelis subcapitata]|eukprot:GBF95970.1 hypothetical protein Rsub_08093 [Raphidocelis subcapitata]
MSGGAQQRRQRAPPASSAARITFASISLPGAADGGDPRTGQAVVALQQHAQRLLGSLRLDTGGPPRLHGPRPAAPLAWLRLPGGRKEEGSSAAAAGEAGGSGTKQQHGGSGAHGTAPQQRQPLFPPCARQRRAEAEQQQQQQQADGVAAAAEAAAPGKGQMLVAAATAATTAATTLLAAASSSLPGAKHAPPPPPEPEPDPAAAKRRNSLRHRRGGEGAKEDAAADVVAIESLDGGRRRVYRLRTGFEDGKHWHGFDMVEDEQTHQGRLREIVRNYLLPQGFPDSVAPQYAQYMAWRGVQYFFGGAMSVFTTKCLLGALGVGGRHAGEAAAAINWVLKDGAGRLGRFLFARWGRELDCELKQFRLAGDILMEAGAALELCTILAPNMFLPLACTANLAKNLAAVANSSTRAPIYRTFALQNNLLGDPVRQEGPPLDEQLHWREHEEREDGDDLEEVHVVEGAL